MSKKIKIKIDDQIISCEEGRTVLDVARDNNIFLPSLCEHPDLSIKANCRVCVVEIKGRKKLVTSCSERVVEGMEIKTNSPKVQESRNLNIELLFAEHIEKCGQCIWRVNCKLLDLAQRYKIKITAFKDRKSQRKTYRFSNAVEIDGTQCIDCRNCIEACSRQGIDYLELAGKGTEQEVVPTNQKNKSCIYCGQCALYCPVGAAQEQTSWEAVNRDLENKEKIIVAQISPAAQISIGEEFGFTIGEDMRESVVGALHELGFSFVFDLTLGNDLASIEEAQKILDKKINKPIITSSCPAGVQYIKSYYPALVKNISPVKSPQIINGRLIKSYWADKNKIKPKNIIVVSVVPCTAQKHEAIQKESKVGGALPADHVLTVRELAWMIKRKNIDLSKVEKREFDIIDQGVSSMYETSGGQASIVLNLALANQNTKRNKELISTLTGEEDAKEVYLDFDNKKMKVAVINGTGNARHVLDNYKNYDYIEMRACPQACVGGGGQAIPTTNLKKKQRADVLRKLDKNDKIDKEIFNKFNTLKMSKTNKKRVGIFSFSCDEGCSIYLVEIFNKKLLEWLEKMELAYFLSVKDHTDIKDIDIAIVEGVITTEEDKEKIEHLRKNCKFVIGMGNCSITGLPSCQRNSFNADQLDEIKDDLKKFKFLPKCMAIKEVIKMDDEIPGCPMDEKKFIETFEKWLNK